MAHGIDARAGPLPVPGPIFVLVTEALPVVGDREARISPRCLPWHLGRCHRRRLPR